MAEYQYIEYEVEQHVARLRVNRPPVNALGKELVRELCAVAQSIGPEAESGAIRCVILSAAGKHFCAGADLKERRGISVEEVEPTVDALREMTTAIADIPVPVIAAVQGSAIGGGMELALAADIRIVASSARMGLRETALAIIPGAGGTQRLPRLVGPSAALEWIATGRIFSAEECLRYGVANRVVADEGLLDAAEQMAREIAANGPVAVRAAKEAIWRGLDEPISAGLELERACYRRTIPTEDRLEALRAFQEKRPPNFTGR